MHDQWSLQVGILCANVSRTWMIEVFAGIRKIAGNLLSSAHI
jgi:hypothetical protein